MKTVKWSGAVGTFGILLAAAAGARAAGSYTLTCDAARSGTVTIELTGFTMAVTGSGEAAVAIGKEAGRTETKFALTVQTDSAKDYQSLLALLDDGELLRSCKLIDGQGAGTTAGKDDWTQESAVKGKNKGKNNKNTGDAQASSGALEWILTDASVTGVTVVAGPNSTGAPTTSIQATIEAQKYSFTM